jgi:membrane-bound lytic murein transglycosylase D
MRLRTPAAFGLVFVFAIAGCAAKQHPVTDLEQSSLQSFAPTAPLQTPAGQYGLSLYPYGAGTAAKADGARVDQFDFSHPRVDDFVSRFQTNLRGFYTRALSRSGRYVSQMSSILQKKGVPQELAYLPLIESGFSVHAVSRAGAVGPWQLIPGTGRRYGLRIDRYVDERRDPVKSTHAAGQYLKELHAMFGDWHLSLAAYNTGEQNIVRILERRRIESFWEMSERGYLYQETSDFVPQFLAALQIAAAPQAYGFETSSEPPLKYEIVKVNRSLALSTIAKLSGTSTEEIKELNPALHRGVIPPSGYAIRVPQGTKETLDVALANYTGPSAPALAEESRTRMGRRSGAVRKAPATRGAQHGKVIASKVKSHRSLGKAVIKTAGAQKARNLRAGRSIARRQQAPIVVAKQKGSTRVLD